MKKIIRLTEGDLHRIVKGSVNKILREFFFPDEDRMSPDESDTNYEEDYWDIVGDKKWLQDYDAEEGMKDLNRFTNDTRDASKAWTKKYHGGQYCSPKFMRKMTKDKDYDF